MNFAMRPFSNYKVLLRIEQLVLEGQRLRTKQRNDEDPISKSRIEVQIQQKREELVPEAETEMVRGIIDKFIFETDSKHMSQVDLSLALKALPARVDESNCYRVELFDFPALQKAIISYKNSD